MSRFDFAIVGAGIAGASFAARVAADARVLLLEREPQPGYHTTGRSAALYSALYGDEPIRALTRASRVFFDRPPPGFAEHPLLTPRGVLYVGTDRDRETVARLCESPLAQSMTQAQARRRVPILHAQGVVCAALEPDACDIDVNGLHQGFLRAARAAGATVVQGAEVRRIADDDGWRIETSGGDFRASVLVDAAGAWADDVAALAGVERQGLQPLRRTAFIIDPSPLQGTGEWPAVVAADESFYFKPDAGMLLASPADETPSSPCDAQPEEWDVAVGVERIESATTLEVRRVVRKWAGLRTFARDRLPVVGYDAQRPAFFWLAGQGGYGVQTAPALSELAAALALRRAVPSRLADEGIAAAAFAPRRRQITETMTG